MRRPQEVPQVTKTILMAANSFRTPPPDHFSGIGLGPYPLPWMPHATDLAQMPHFFLFYFAARQTLRARVLLILCFSGSGGCARERKKMEKNKMLDFSHQHTRLGHTNVCLIRG